MNRSSKDAFYRFTGDEELLEKIAAVEKYSAQEREEFSTLSLL
jgi:hypothetical protein